MTDTISIITVNYNGFDVTCGMIESLAAHMDTPYELIVVDNGSEKDEATMLAAATRTYEPYEACKTEVLPGGTT